MGTRLGGSADGRNDINDKGSHNKGGEHDQNDGNGDGEEPAEEAMKGRKIKPVANRKTLRPRPLMGRSLKILTSFRTRSWARIERDA
jgi:hypothetical protein